MKRQIIALGLAGLATSLLLVSGCGRTSTTATPIPREPTATPYVQDEATVFASPSPTAVPAAERKAVLDFATQYLEISEDWESFRGEFDLWRAGLASCDSAAMTVALSGFASSFVNVTRAAGALPRDAIVRDQADKAIAAAEREEEAIRRLRDEWRPGSAAIFAQVDSERSAASALRKQVEDRLVDLKTTTGTAARGRTEEFAAAFNELNAIWDGFHESYDSFRADEGDLAFAEALSRLDLLVSDFSALVVAVRGLPASDSTAALTRLLSQATENEELELRRLRSAFQLTGTSTETQTDSEQPSESGERPSGTAQQPASGAGGSSIFDSFDARVVRSNDARRQVNHDLPGALEASSEENRVSVQDFATRYAALTESWDAFHAGYDGWRAIEGGCDRSDVAASLAQLAIQFGAIAGRVRLLPRATFLQPVGELFVEAIELEEEALQALRDAWRPFDPQVYGPLDAQRSEARRLRRQVSVGVQSLLDAYAIPIGEVGGRP